MEFDENRPIYLQIADTLSEKILDSEWVTDQRIPSVRELGIELGVNPNTVMRSYDYLQTNDIIYNKRGIGYFVSISARENILCSLREQFLNQEIPYIIKKMKLLSITTEQFNQILCNNFQIESSNNRK